MQKSCRHLANFFFGGRNRCVSNCIRRHDRARNDAQALASTERNINREWRGTVWNGMERGWSGIPVIAVIVGSRDPTTHLNYLYLSPGPRRFHFCISQLDASVRFSLHTSQFSRIICTHAHTYTVRLSANSGVNPRTFIITRRRRSQCQFLQVLR